MFKNIAGSLRYVQRLLGLKTFHFLHRIISSKWRWMYTKKATFHARDCNATWYCLCPGRRLKDTVLSRRPANPKSLLESKYCRCFLVAYAVFDCLWTCEQLTVFPFRCVFLHAGCVVYCHGHYAFGYFFAPEMARKKLAVYVIQMQRLSSLKMSYSTYLCYLT